VAQSFPRKNYKAEELNRPRTAMTAVSLYHLSAYTSTSPDCILSGLVFVPRRAHRYN
jgi:hypothetical protein